MDKIVLKDKTEILIREGSGTNIFQVEGKEREELIELCKQLTKENLSEYCIYNSAGLLCSIYKNKELAGSHIDEKSEEVEGLLFTIELAPVSTIEKRLADVEETVDALMTNSLGVE
jgi:hypothetical protein